MRRLSRLPGTRLTVLFAVLTLGPLLALAVLSVDRSGAAVEEEARARLASTATVTAALVRAELQSLTELVDSYGTRPAVVRAFADSPSRERAESLAPHLLQLRAQRSGIAVAFATEADGRLIEVRPATPAIVGRDFSYRDWYRGLAATGGPYVSRAYVTAASGRARVVAAAARVRAGDPPYTAGILVVGYSLEYLRALAQRLAREQGVVLRVTDHGGTVVAGPGSEGRTLRNAAGDAAVAAALRGASGTETDGARDAVRAYAPVTPFGWTVTATLPRDVAFARVSGVRAAVLGIAAPLALVLLAGIVLLGLALRGRERAEARERAALETARYRNEELEAQTEALTDVQRRLEGALASAQRLAEINGAVLDATTDAIRMVDLDGRTVVVNRAMRETFQPILRFRGDGTIWELTETLAERTADPDAYRAAMAALRDDPGRESVDEYELVDTGTWIQRYSAPVRADDGEVVGRIFVLRDVTRERLADRAKAELVATVSHELRTPLTGILGFAELLAAHDADEEAQRQYVDVIVGEASRLRDLLNDFLDLQRVEEGRLTVAAENVALNPVLETQTALCAAQSNLHRVELDADEHLQVVGERNRIAQMLANLLSNAVKYSPAGGTVRVRARRTGAVVRIEVADEGIGIPADQQSRIFERFFRADSSDTRRIGGTGLGLALVRELAEAHGGTAGFESVEGRGSTFWVELPRAYRPEEEQTARPLALVVGDDPVMAALLHEALGDLGYELELCASGTEALDRIDRRRPDVVLLDIGLPGRLDGWEVLRRVTTAPATRSIPVIACSAGDHAERARALGATGFIGKPFAPEELAERLRALAPKARRLVLVVDEEERVRNLVAVALEREPVSVIEAADGLEALELIETRRPDVLVLDLHLPRLDGFGVLERLRGGSDMPRVPTIVLTGIDLDAAAAASLRSRGVWLLEKGAYSAPELRRLVRAALAAAETARAA